MSAVKKRTPIVRDMTEGNPIKLILAFYFPLFIGNLFQQMYTMADTAVVGHFIGDSAISAVGATSSLYVLMMSIASSMNNGFAIITTQMFGAKESDKLRQSVAGSFVLNGFVALVLTLAFSLFLRPIMRLLNTPESIFEDAHIYMLTLCLGMATTLAYNMFASILRAVGNGRTPLYFLIFSSITNITLDILFVLPLKMGVFGAALATVIAQGLSAIFCGIYIYQKYKFVFPKIDDFKKSTHLWGKMLSMGASLSLGFCVLHVGSVILQGATNSLGETVVAAHVAANKIVGVTMEIILLLGTALATFISQNYGAGKYDRIKYALKRVVFIAVCCAIAISVFGYAFGGSLIRLITGTTNREIISNACLNLNIVLPGFIPLAVLHCVRSAMQAIGQKLPSIISGFLELVAKSTGAFLLVPILGYLGVCITSPIMWVICSTFFVIIYLVKSKKLFS